MRIRPPALGQHGGTTALVAVAATTLLGFASLATEVGGWYLLKRNAVTAADLAALAGASAVEAGIDPVVMGRDTAQLNGFSAGSMTTVDVYHPPQSGALKDNASAVEVLISRTQSISLAGLFQQTAPTVRSRAVAASNIEANVCVLALGGGVSLSGSSITTMQNCALGSNAAAPGGIAVGGSAALRTAQVLTTGTCTGCSTGNVWTSNAQTTRPVIASNRAQPLRDPFADLQRWMPSPPACGPAVRFTNGAATLSPGQSICSSVTVGTNDTLTLNPGIYYFNNADLTWRGRVTGNGVTIVFTGDPDRVGTIQIGAQAQGNLSGPTSPLVPNHPESAGMIIYRDARATNNGTGKEVQLNGGGSLLFNGGMYLPTSDVVVNGNSTMASTCLALVAYRLSFSGNSDLGVSGCVGYSPYPRIRTVRLAE